MQETIGKVNRYVCEQCRAVHGTINLNTGVTPFLIGCKSDCGGMAQSSMYRLPAGETSCGWAWYRPIPDEFRRITVDEQEHILAGGLILGDLAEVTPLREPDDVHAMMQGGQVDRWLSYVAAAYKPDSEMFHGIVARLKGQPA